jgi:hypothetical protein
LQRNKERREARERQGKKGSFSTGDVMSPEATTPGSPMTMMPVPGKTATTRKCANCGQAGHIRKRLSVTFVIVINEPKC